jgi:DNA-binding response OmpR family regulator
MAKVLLVDDEGEVVGPAREGLERAGHQVRTAADETGALAAVRAEPPDAVVLDVDRPGTDGWSVLGQLKRDRDDSVRKVPVLLVSALDTETDRARGGIEGAVRYLTKPVAVDDVVAAVEDVLAGPPEAEQRWAALRLGLIDLARLEREAAGGAPPAHEGPRLRRLEHLRVAAPPLSPSPARPLATSTRPPITGHTAKQRDLLMALAAAPTVSAAASQLGTSRSNVYARHRRGGRKIGIVDVSELLWRLRSGDLAAALGP